MKPIYILALHGVRTGGPEAIHQLSDALITQGFDARLVYFTFGEIAQLERAGSAKAYRFSRRENDIEDYAHYQTKLVTVVPNEEGVIIVLPETLCHLVPKFDRATVLVWWLSVDNGFGALARVNLNHLRKSNVKHACQSVYAVRFLEALDLPNAGMLSDYTVIPEGIERMPWSKRPKRVLINATPHKVIADIEAIERTLFWRARDAEVVRITGKSRREVAELMASSRVYLDLGNFPGKDRMPREAEALGCVPVVLFVGGAYWDDLGQTTTIEDVGNDVSFWVNAPDMSETALVDERPTFFREAEAVFRGL